MRKATLSLSVIDGGGRPLPLTLHRPAGDGACTPLIPLLEAAGASFGVEEGPFGVPFLRLARPEGAGEQKEEPLRIVHVRALPGVVKTKTPDLDLRVLALPEGAPPSTGMLARVLAGTKTGGKKVAVGVDPARAGLPSSTAAEAATLLTTDPGRLGLILAEAQTAEIFAATAVALAGGAVTAYETLRAPHGSSYAPRVPAQGSPGAMGLVLASVAAFADARQSAAAGALHNAWLCALEDGLHTDEASLTRPYTVAVSGAEFCREVQNRLGDEPRTLQPMHYAGEEERQRPSLKVLS